MIRVYGLEFSRIDLIRSLAAMNTYSTNLLKQTKLKLSSVNELSKLVKSSEATYTGVLFCRAALVA